MFGLVALLAADLGLVAGIAKTRLRVIDLAFCGLMLSLTLSWVAHPELGVSFKWFAEGMVPFAYYVWARLTLTERLLSQLQWVMLISSGLAACTLLYEAVHGTTVFADPHIYQWAGSAASGGGAGGVFGGSPTAAIILATMLLASVSLYKTHRLVVLGISVVVIAGIIVTLDRAGLIGLLLGAPLMAVLSPYRHWGRIAIVTFAVGVAVYAIGSSPETLADLESSKLVNSGVVRSNTLDQRANLMSESLPLLTDSPSHFVWGRGFNSLEAPAGLHDYSFAATPECSIPVLTERTTTSPGWSKDDGPWNALFVWLLEELLLGIGLFALPITCGLERTANNCWTHG